MDAPLSGRTAGLGPIATLRPLPVESARRARAQADSPLPQRPAPKPDGGAEHGSHRAELKPRRTCHRCFSHCVASNEHTTRKAVLLLRLITTKSHDEEVCTTRCYRRWWFTRFTAPIAVQRSCGLRTDLSGAQPTPEASSAESLGGGQACHHVRPPPSSMISDQASARLPRQRDQRALRRCDCGSRAMCLSRTTGGRRWAESPSSPPPARERRWASRQARIMFASAPGRVRGSPRYASLLPGRR